MGRFRSMLAAGALIFATGCEATLPIPEPTTDRSAFPATVENKMSVIRRVAAALGWKRTLEGAARTKRGREIIEAAKPDLINTLHQQQVAFDNLTRGTGYSRCPSDEKSKTDTCRAKALITYHCPDEVARETVNFSAALAAVLINPSQWNCSKGEGDEPTLHEETEIPLDFSTDATDALLEAAERKPRQSTLPDKMDVDDPVNITPDMVEGWTPACMRSASDEKQPDLRVDKVGDAPGFPSENDGASKVDNINFKGISALTKYAITFSTTDALKMPGGSEKVEACLNSAASKLNASAQSILFAGLQKEMQKPVIQRNYLFWLYNQDFLSGIADNGREFGDAYLECLKSR